MTITSDAPEWDDLSSADMEMPERQVVAGKGDYETYLEQRIPPFVQSQPHWCAKNLLSVELEPLVTTAIDKEEAKLETALYAHPSLGTEIEQFPDGFLLRVKDADDSLLRSVARNWAACMSTPEFTHSINGERLSDDWTVDDALRILESIAELARQHTDGQSMYLLTET